MLLNALLVSIRATILFKVSGFQENFVHLIICSCLGPMVSKQKGILPCSAFPLPALLPSPAAYYLSAMSNVVQREAGEGSRLSQPRDNSYGAQQK